MAPPGYGPALETNSPNEAMSHNGRVITCNKKNADIFAGLRQLSHSSHYRTQQ